MSDMLSQDEINALLGGLPLDEPDDDIIEDAEKKEPLSTLQKDVLGEIGNISMGTAATTLFSLLNQKVIITSPEVKILDWEQISNLYDKPCVGVKIDYKSGLEGSNTLIMKNTDVKIITDLMMGGDGNADINGELTELDLSAIGEAMNQMIGSSSTSLAQFLKQKIDIDIPKPFVINFNNGEDLDIIKETNTNVVIFFKIYVGNLINSDIVQIMPVEFAETLSDKLIVMFGYDKEINADGIKNMDKNESVQAESGEGQAPAPKQEAPGGVQQEAASESGKRTYSSIEEESRKMSTPTQQTESKIQQDVNAQPVEFQEFDTTVTTHSKENINLLMDVPLDVTVELGKTSKSIKDILEFSPGTIIELDKLAGEPIDILVNGKYVAKGEVVVIDENFAIRVTSIINAELRI